MSPATRFVFWGVLRTQQSSLSTKLWTDYFSLCHGAILSLSSYEKIWFNICTNWCHLCEIGLLYSQLINPCSNILPDILLYCSKLLDRYCVWEYTVYNQEVPGSCSKADKWKGPLLSIPAGGFSTRTVFSPVHGCGALEQLYPSSPTARRCRMEDTQSLTFKRVQMHRRNFIGGNTYD